MSRPSFRRTGLVALVAFSLIGCLTEKRARELAQDEARTIIDTFRGTEVMPSLRDLEDAVARESEDRKARDRRVGDLLAAVDRTMQSAREDLTSARKQFDAMQADVAALRTELEGHDGRLVALQGRSDALASDLTKLELNLSTSLRRDLTTLAETLARLETRESLPSTDASVTTETTAAMRSKVDTAGAASPADE